jgi:hypothetical protein
MCGFRPIVRPHQDERDLGERAGAPFYVLWFCVLWRFTLGRRQHWHGGARSLERVFTASHIPMALGQLCEHPPERGLSVGSALSKVRDSDKSKVLGQRRETVISARKFIEYRFSPRDVLDEKSVVPLPNQLKRQV